MTVITQPKYRLATILPDFSIKYESIINCLCDIKDTLVYQVCYPDDPDYCLRATVFISMNFTKPIICSNDTIETVNQTLLNFTILENDFIPVEFNVSIARQPEYGIATMEADKSITYQSTLCCNFKHITDTIVYKVCNQNGPLNCSLAFVYLTLDFTTSVKESELNGLQIWPNPVVSELNIDAENPVSMVEIFDLTGKSLSVLSPMKSEFTVPMPEVKGVYFVRIKTSSGETVMRKVVKL